MIYDGTSKGALKILDFVGIDTVRSFIKKRDGDLILERRHSSDYSFCLIKKGNNVFVRASGELAIVEEDSDD